MEVMNTNPIDIPVQAGAILFDFDGTLLDSFPAHYEAYRRMFTRFGIPVTEERFFTVYSPDWYQVYQAMGLPRELWEKANDVWMEEAARHHSDLFPGVPDILSRLRHVFPLGVVTSGSKNRVLRDMDRTGIRVYFEVVITGDDIRLPKPAPEGLLLALGAMGIAPEKAVYIGDALADYEMAQAAGVRFIGIPSQFASLKPENPVWQVSSIRKLAEVFGVE
jgi:HAD superfamily hydrolase (TIGR01549 family)